MTYLVYDSLHLASAKVGYLRRLFSFTYPQKMSKDKNVLIQIKISPCKGM